MARVRHGQGRGLPRRPARGAADVRGGHRRDLPARALGSAVQPHARGKIDQRRFGGHTRNHGEAPVRRACFAADRTGHMILQTLYQQCVKRNVRFFNEFYVLDQLMVDGACAGVVAYELATGELHVFRSKAVLFATGRLRPDVQGLLQRAHADGRRPRGAVPSRAAARGHGVLPVPPDRRLQDGHPAFGGGPRRGRHPAEQRGRALHGALRADRQGPRPPRHGQPRDLPGDQGGSRRRAQARRGVARRPPPAARGDRGEAAGRDRVRPRLPRRRADHRARPDPADRALRDGRHPDQRRRAGRRRRGRDAGPGPVRGRRMRVRLGPRREPPGDELAARHRGVRTPRRRPRGRVLRARPTCPSSPNAPRGWSARWSTAC